MRRTKIVCTLGPASRDPEIIARLIDAGANVVRLNFSHGTHEQHAAAFSAIRKIAASKSANVAVLMDLQGPKIRTGKLQNAGSVTLEEGKPLTITTEDVLGDARRVSTTYQNLPHDVQPGARILLADGLLELRVDCIDPPEVHCTVVRGGVLGQQKGINLPGVAVSAPSLTEKDIEDLQFGLELGVDFVALSFVRSPEDVLELKRRISAAGKSTPVVAKIERPEALSCFNGILDVTDAVMVARGDLGVEVDLCRVPQIQKTLIRMCNERGIPVITATQMLESMVTNARPTRAEVADVANAIYDGTDAIMLSGETAAGAFPVEAVAVMAQIAESADEAIAHAPRRDAFARFGDPKGNSSFNDAIGQAVARMTQVTRFHRIVVLTQSGYSAVAIARYRPQIPITAITLCEETRRLCALIWGVDAVASVEVQGMDDMVRVVDEILLGHKLAEPGNPVVIVAGTPLGIGGRTNLLHLHQTGERFPAPA
ncbi:MAG: pyruvate kinase [Candidatus Hydrogenedentes bacterium]|nr:pyruvate kinase [Candidatus Hydrogenedentota bacterium]